MNFAINNSQDKQTLFNYLKELDTDYIVKVKKQRNNRSTMQNNYYWACIVQPLGESLGYFPDEMHDTLKVKFSSEWQSIDINDKQIGLQTVNSTARMNTKDFEVYADQIRIWALTELGVRLMLPNEFK
jgi:hypothetical protein